MTCAVLCIGTELTRGELTNTNATILSAGLTDVGFGVRIGEALAFFMPGVPREMERMFEEQVVPRVRALAPNNGYQVRLRSFGLPESQVGDRLAGVEQTYAGVTIGYRAHFPEI